MTTDTLLALPAERMRALHAAYDGAVAVKRRTSLVFGFVVALLVLVSGWVGEVDLMKLGQNVWRFPAYFAAIVPTLRWGTLPADLAEWFWGWKHWLRLLGDTLLVAYVGTVLGAAGGFLLCFAAAGNVVRSRTLQFAARRFLEICRTVPEIVFALVFVVAFGLGPLPGVLAIAIHTTGALGKLFAEVVENIDMKPVEGLASTGAGWASTMRFAVVPQILSNVASYSLLRFEVNVREAAVLGFVGAGGIGQDLLEAVRKFYYSDVSAILLLLIATVVVIDLVTERVRHALLGLEPGR